jgi:hypothetical protein
MFRTHALLLIALLILGGCQTDPEQTDATPIQSIEKPALATQSGALDVPCNSTPDCAGVVTGPCHTAMCAGDKCWLVPITTPVPPGCMPPDGDGACCHNSIGAGAFQCDELTDPIPLPIQTHPGKYCEWHLMGKFHAGKTCSTVTCPGCTSDANCSGMNAGSCQEAKCIANACTLIPIEPPPAQCPPSGIGACCWPVWPGWTCGSYSLSGCTLAGGTFHAAKWCNQVDCPSVSECTNGDTQEGTTVCGQNNEGFLFQTCTNGAWVDSTSCT